MRRILVTGANGFIGRAVVPALAKAGHSVCAGVRAPSEAAWLAGVDQRVIGDLGPDTDWTGALADVDAVVHLAARVHVGRPRRDRGLAGFRRVNSEGTRRLAEEAARSGVQRFLFMSSTKVNGERTERDPFREDYPAAPAGPYGVTKWEAERALLEIASRTPMEAVILRAPQVYGPGVKGSFLRLLRACGSGIPLPFGSADNQRSLIAAGNLADAVRLCLEHPAAAGETFLVRDGDDVSTPELVRRLASALERPARLVAVPLPWVRWAARAAGREATVARLLDPLAVDDGKFRKALGWTPPRRMEDELAPTASWFMSEARHSWLARRIVRRAVGPSRGLRRIGRPLRPP